MGIETPKIVIFDEKHNKRRLSLLNHFVSMRGWETKSFTHPKVAYTNMLGDTIGIVVSTDRSQDHSIGHDVRSHMIETAHQEGFAVLELPRLSAEAPALPKQLQEDLHAWLGGLQLAPLQSAEAQTPDRRLTVVAAA